MADNASIIETRSFPQIWLGLKRSERGDLAADLFKAKACKTYQTVHNWGNGKCAPTHPAILELVAKTVSKYLEKKCSPTTLFPEA